IADGKASRKHCRVFSKPDGTVWVEDLESANGTEINDDEIFSPRKLVDGDQIIIGKAKIRFLGDTVETTPANGMTVIQADPKELLDRLVGGCRLTAVIAAGHSGTVYRAKQLSLGREVAVKIFKSEMLKRDPGFAERFLTEARRAGSVMHPNVVQIHECGHDDGLLWYCMELVEGDTLEDLVTRDGQLDATLALVIAEQASHALQAAHAKNVMHGDVNPGNLMLAGEGKLKLLDLGLVRVLNSGRTAAGKKRVIGNPWYMSPERAKGEAGDARSDIYSLGCVLFHLITGHPPFDDDNPKEILKAHLERPIPNASDTVSGLPKKVDELLQSMLSKNPSWRYGSIDEVLPELRAARDAVVKNPVKGKVKNGSSANAAGQAKSNGAAVGGGDHAAQAAVNLERSQVRAECAQQRSIRNLVVLVILVVILGVAYSFSGISFSALINNVNNHKAGTAAGPFTDPVTASTKPPVSAAAGDPQPTPSPTGNQAGESWKAAQQEIDALVRQGDWGAAELRLQRADDELKKVPDGASLTQGVRLKNEQLHLDGETWYRAQVIALPEATTAANVAPRLARLSELRDRALATNRGDAKSHYQELVTRLDQQLKAARRQARQAVEAGKLETLPAIAKQLEPWFVGTPLVGVQRQFSSLVSEAAAAKPLWKGEWAATRENLLAAKGEAALAAGAALILAGQGDAARALLLGDAALGQGALVRRREALFGREATILSFSDLGNLQYIETLQGEVRLQDKALTGVGTEACGLAITVPVGGATWNAGLTLKLGKGTGQAVVSCVKAETAEFSLRIEADKLVLKVHSAIGWENVEPKRPAGPLAIRLVCRANTLQVLVNNQVVSETKQARIPAGSQLRIEVADLAWTLDEVQVVGE
ncbi:MAG TPA: FHA domain-containing serine/threonine-protein kinase, partial [Planctomycetota bacterium]|nr:FHA domain-containing serine/threonine-protein kinase [Planctomycetota bacterium]